MLIFSILSYALPLLLYSYHFDVCLTRYKPPTELKISCLSTFKTSCVHTIRLVGSLGQIIAFSQEPKTKEWQLIEKLFVMNLKKRKDSFNKFKITLMNWNPRLQEFRTTAKRRYVNTCFFFFVFFFFCLLSRIVCFKYLYDNVREQINTGLLV